MFFKYCGCPFLKLLQSSKAFGEIIINHGIYLPFTQLCVHFHQAVCHDPKIVFLAIHY